MDIADVGVASLPRRRAVHAFEVALIAAILDPEGSKTEPDRAVDTAAKLITAAQEEIDRPFHERAAERLASHTFNSEFKRLFPESAKQLTIPEAFRLFPSGYKTERQFCRALYEEGLAVYLTAREAKAMSFQKPFSYTTEIAVRELSGRRLERKKVADRNRKRRARQRTLQEKSRQSPLDKKRTDAAKNRKDPPKHGTLKR